MLLGRWLANFQEITHSEEEVAIAIDEGRQLPNRPVALTQEIDAEIEQEKARIAGFLGNEFNDGQFAQEMSRYFGRIGHLIGFNPPRRDEYEEIVGEEMAMDEANANLDASGLLIQELHAEDVVNENEEFENQENIEP